MKSLVAFLSFVVVIGSISALLVLKGHWISGLVLAILLLCATKIGGGD